MPSQFNGQKTMAAITIGVAIILLAAGILYALGADIRIRDNKTTTRINHNAIERNCDDIKDIELAQQAYCDTTETKLDDIKTQVDRITGFLMPGVRPQSTPK